MNNGRALYKAFPRRRAPLVATIFVGAVLALIACTNVEVAENTATVALDIDTDASPDSTQDSSPDSSQVWGSDSGTDSGADAGTGGCFAAANPASCCIPDPALVVVQGVNAYTGQQLHQAVSGFGPLDVRVSSRGALQTFATEVRVAAGFLNTIAYGQSYCLNNGKGGYVFTGPDANGFYWNVNADGSRSPSYIAFDAAGFPYLRDRLAGVTYYYNRPGDGFTTASGPAWRLATIESAYPDGTPIPNVDTVVWNTGYVPPSDARSFSSYTTPVNGGVVATFNASSVVLDVTGIAVPYTETLTQVAGVGPNAIGVKQNFNAPYAIDNYYDVLLGDGNAYSFSTDTRQAMVLAPSSETPVLFSGSVASVVVNASPTPATLSVVEADPYPVTVTGSVGGVNQSSNGATSSLRVDGITGLVTYEDDGAGNTTDSPRDRLGRLTGMTVRQAGAAIATSTFGYDNAVTGQPNYFSEDDLGGVTSTVVNTAYNATTLAPTNVVTTVNGIQTTVVPVYTLVGPYLKLLSSAVTIPHDVWGGSGASTNTTTFTYPSHLTVTATDTHGNTSTVNIDANDRPTNATYSGAFAGGSAGVGYGPGGYVSSTNSSARLGSGVPLAGSSNTTITGATVSGSYSDLNGLLTGDGGVTFAAGGGGSVSGAGSFGGASSSASVTCTSPFNCTNNDSYVAPGGITGGGSGTADHTPGTHHTNTTATGADNSVPRSGSSDYADYP